MSLEPVIGKNLNDLVAGELSVCRTDCDLTSSDTSHDSICVDGLLSGVMVGEETLK